MGRYKENGDTNAKRRESFYLRGLSILAGGGAVGLIDGAAYDMSPDAWCRHQEIAVEILSPYTSIKDQREKLALYEHFEVKEYWIIDPANYMAALYSLRLTGGAEYGKPELFGLGDQLHSRLLDGFSLDLATLFAE